MEIIFKDRIRALRQERGETQVQVAEAIGVAGNHIISGLKEGPICRIWKTPGSWRITSASPLTIWWGEATSGGNMRWAAVAAASGISAPAGLVRQDAPPFSFGCAKRECAAPGGREKALRRVGLRQRRPPAAGGDGWHSLAEVGDGNAPPFGESLGPGRFRDTPASLSAAAHASAENQPARSDAERAKREAGQMRSCTPTTSAPSATGRQLGNRRRPKRARRLRQNRSRHRYADPRQRGRATAPERVQAAFLFGPCTARFLFGKTEKKMGCIAQLSS